MRKSTFLSLYIGLLFCVLAWMAKSLGLSIWPVWRVLLTEVVWFTCVVFAVVRYNGRLLPVRSLIKDRQALSLFAFSAAAVSLGVFHGFDANAARRVLPLMLLPCSYWVFYKVSSRDVSIGALLAMVLYAITFWKVENTQIYIIHVGTLGLAAVDGVVLLDIVVFLLIFAGGVAVKSLGTVLSISTVSLCYFVRESRYWLYVVLAIVLVMFFFRGFLSTNSVNYRLDFWLEAFELFMSNPFLGSGLGHTYLIQTGKLIPHAHNLFFSTLGEMGVVGIAALFWIIFNVITRWRTIPFESKIALIGFMVWSQTDEPFYWACPLVVLGAVLSRRMNRSCKEDNNGAAQ